MTFMRAGSPAFATVAALLRGFQTLLPEGQYQAVRFLLGSPGRAVVGQTGCRANQFEPHWSEDPDLDLLT